MAVHLPVAVSPHTTAKLLPTSILWVPSLSSVMVCSQVEHFPARMDAKPSLVSPIRRTEPPHCVECLAIPLHIVQVYQCLLLTLSLLLFSVCPDWPSFLVHLGSDCQALCLACSVWYLLSSLVAIFFSCKHPYDCSCYFSFLLFPIDVAKTIHLAQD